MNKFYYFGNTCGFIRIFGLVLLWKHKSSPPLFSEREGYRKYLRIGSYRFRLELK